MLWLLLFFFHSVLVYREPENWKYVVVLYKDVESQEVANNALLCRYCDIPSGEMIEWVNAVGLILTWLPEPYWIVVHDRIIELLQVG